MQQSALNLLAIGIFTITFSILLGPFLRISPAVPAVATFGILSLVTVDTLGWNSRGVTLLLDTLASAEHRERVIRHEAGHFLAAYFLGIPITGYTLSAWEAWKQGQPGLGGVELDTSGLLKTAQLASVQALAVDAPSNRLIVDRFCTVWMAGVAAEKLVYARSEGGDEDRQKIREVLKLVGSPHQSQQKEDWALLQAKSLIDKHREAYEALVIAMTKRASVTECAQAIQQQTAGGS
ncbi:MAG: ATP-dependent Zn protease [Cyanophyceae cyanobacterium]